MNGYVHLARMIDKCRAVLAGTEGEYIYPCPMDDRLMEFAGITADQFTVSVKASPSDEAVANWFTRTAQAHAPAELDAWNRMMLTADRAVPRNERTSTNSGIRLIPHGPTSRPGPTCKTWKKAGQYRDVRDLR
jgi:hypothetical protein